LKIRCVRYFDISDPHEAMLRRNTTRSSLGVIVDNATVSSATGFDPPIAGAQPFRDDCIARIHCTDVDELGEQVRDWQAEYAQLRCGACRATGLMIPLGPVLVSSIAFGGSLLHRATPPAGCLSFVLRGRDSDRLLIRGRDLMDDQCLVLCTGSDVDVVSRGESVVLTACVNDDAWHAASHWVGASSLAMGKGVRLRTPGKSWIASARTRMEWIVDAYVRHKEGVQRPEVRASMADLVLACLSDAADTTTQPRNDRRERIHQRFAVQRACNFIHDHLTSPIRLSELCASAHAQARSLEYGFQEIFGLSPVSYIRTLRLNRAHRLLRSRDTAQRTITEIALDCGFWHLSQFAVDYKILFGESPSVTYSRTSAQLPRAKRRLQPNGRTALRADAGTRNSIRPLRTVPSIPHAMS
jgi:AraC family transcriptional regulator, ethanolamine operon transcriptional activator